jgi:hypothetical protein
VPDRDGDQALWRAAAGGHGQVPALTVAVVTAPCWTFHFSRIFWYSPFLMIASRAALRASRSWVSS